jgi:hypothetical protein
VQPFSAKGSILRKVNHAPWTLHLNSYGYKLRILDCSLNLYPISDTLNPRP